LHPLFDESPMAIGCSRDGITLDANAAYLSLFGYASVTELHGKSILAQIAPSHRTRIVEIVAQRARGEHAPPRYQTRGLRKDGTEFPFEVTTTRFVMSDGPVTIAFISDVSERDDAIDALRASEEMFRTLSGAALEAVFVHAEGKIVLANEAGAAMYGYADPTSMVGASLMDLTAPESRALVVDHVQRGSSQPYEGIACRKDGSTFIAEVRARTLSRQGPKLRVAIIRDITEQKRVDAEQRALAERVRHAQKLESLGVLAGGIAHDFNNILTVIANGVTLARHDVDAGASPRAHLDSIALAAERAADLCRQMLAYAGKAAFAREAVDLTALVAEMSTMLEASIATKATLERKLLPYLPKVLGDATQIRQVVMNLVINGAEAIDGPRGTLEISTGTDVYAADAFAHSAAAGAPKPGRYVYVEIRDDGIGMDAATVAKMFDPFFMTKFVGRGLGMAAVLGIVRGHAGAIDVDSHPGAGTRVRVFFPVSTVEPSNESGGAPTSLRGEGVVLVADDEAGVRRSTQLLLEGCGYDVIVARDGVEAVAAFEANFERLGAVLLDLTMPRKDGLETLKDLRRIAPNVPVILISGYGAQSDALTGGPAPDAAIAKPYGVQDLLTALKKVMRAQRNP
jgi:PAS domain S-box-containing protein